MLNIIKSNHITQDLLTSMQIEIYKHSNGINKICLIISF